MLCIKGSNWNPNIKLNKRKTKRSLQKEPRKWIFVPGERSYNDTFIWQKKNLVIVVLSSFLKKTLIKLKVVCKFFSWCNIERFCTLYKANFAGKWIWCFNLTYWRKWCVEIMFQYWHCIKRYQKYCKPLQRFWCEANHDIRFDTYNAFKCKFYLPA